MEALSFSLAEIDELSGPFGALTAKLPMDPIANAFYNKQCVQRTRCLMVAPRTMRIRLRNWYRRSANLSENPEFAGKTRG